MKDKCVAYINSCSPGAYIELVRRNRNYRLYLLSHLCQHGGDWFVRIAAILSAGRLKPGSATALSFLILARAIPEIAFSPIGGLLADRFDRRKLMIFFDSLAALAALGFIVALRFESIRMLYVATAFRSIISALYEPITKSIVPMFVQGPEELKFAATLNGMAWSSMLMIGGVIAGYASATFGIEACYGMDICC